MSATATDVPDNFFDPRRPWLRWRPPIVVAASVLVLAAAGAFAVNLVSHACGGVRSGITSIDGECVGITDGDYLFSPDFKAVEEKIKAENDWVRHQPAPYVNVVLLSPLTFTETSALSKDQILHSLQGSYVAQRRANHSEFFGDRQQPLIRLLLANEGSRENQWKPVVDQIEGLVRQADHPVVAVVGLGVSIENTRSGARHLHDHDVPMVAAVLSADGLDTAHIPGLIRVTPNTTDYTTALGRYLAAHRELKSGMLVYDSNQPDLYVASLRASIERDLKEYLTSDPQSFVGALIQSKATPQRFDGVTKNICAELPDMVFYAGRALDLHSFIDSLSSRTCRKRKPLTILVGATGLSSVRQDLTKLQDGDIKVRYASAADPGWQSGSPGAPEYFPQFLAAFRGEVGVGPGTLDDGYAIMHHDALATAVTAIRLASSPTDGGQSVTAADVGSQLLNLNSAYKVRGGSGTLIFSSRREGNAGNKPVPIVSVPAEQPDPTPYVTPST